LLYRLLESSQAYVPSQSLMPPNTPNTSGGARITGKININTIWDKAVLDALLDFANNSNNSSFNIDTQFKAFLDSRSPQVSGLGVVGATDDLDPAKDGVTTSKPNLNVPFKSLNVGLYPAANAPIADTRQLPNGLGLQNTVFRDGPGTPGKKLFQLTNSTDTYPGGLPVNNYQLLSKIFNNITTRSNVFAVWVTVGFFEVVDESVVPVKLGAEIGRTENRHVRHRMFAIIDRTQIATPIYQGTVTKNVTAGNQAIMSPVSATLSSAGQAQVTLTIKAGMSVTIDSGNPKNKETVTVQSVNTNGTFTATVGKGHAANAIVTLPIPAIPSSSAFGTGYYGNPGPQPQFDMRQNTAVVPYFSIVQ
jgi:hypothetical protein